MKKNKTNKLPQWAYITLFSYSTLFTLMLISLKTKAQTTPEQGTENVTSILDYQPTILNSVKISDLPTFKDSAPAMPKLTYKIIDAQYDMKFIPDAIQPAVVKGEPLTKLYRNLVKVGFGNYNTAYGEYFYNNVRAKKHSYGVHAKHLSSNGNINELETNPGLNDNAIDAHFKYLFKDYSLYSTTGYTSNVVHYYGYSPNFRNELSPAYPSIASPKWDSSKDIVGDKQRFQSWNVSTLLASNFDKNSENFNNATSLQYSGIADDYGMNEQRVNLSTNVGKKHEEEYLYVRAGVDFYNNKNSTLTQNTTFVTLNPKIKFNNKTWLLDVGAKIVPVFAKDNNRTYFYPDVNAGYQLLPNFINVYVNLGGNAYRNSFKTLTDVNAFMHNSASLQNTNHQIDANGGVKGQLTKRISYNVHAGYDIYKNFALYVLNDAFLLNNVFTTVYDNVNRAHVGGELNYQLHQKLVIATTANYYNYKATKELKVWYMPDLIINTSAKYNLEDKLIATVQLNYLNTQYARKTTYDAKGVKMYETIKLNSFVDANLGVEYRYNKRLSAYLQFNNLAAQRYYRFINYPSQRFNVMGGITYGF
ncbi:MAG: TonB-dependent receptor [Bacteroidia bacterium]|nr:TonB-dependent receptor [Bacteroidia bacterium]